MKKINKNESNIPTSKFQRLTSNSAITLVALVITIIVLLILAGITLSLTLGDNGIFGSAKNAKEKYNYSQAKEKLQINIIEFKTNIMEEANLEEFKKFMKGKELEYDVGDVIDEKLNIYDKQYKYNFILDKELNILENKAGLYKTTGAYEILSKDGSKTKIRIYLDNIIGINKIICPNGEVINGENKKQIKFEYELESNSIYEFKVTSLNEEEVLRLDPNKESPVEITETTLKAYSIITEKGIVGTNKYVNIIFNGNGGNYYSIDNGENWKEYTEQVSITKEGTIMAKSVTENEVTKINKKDINLELANDALGNKICDNDNKTYDGSIGVKYLQIEDKMQGEKIEIDAEYWSSYTDSYYEFLDENKQIIGTKIKPQRNKEETIPQGAKYIKFTNCLIYEVKIPMIEIRYTPNYPEFTTEGIEARNSIVTINYYKFARQKLYSLDNQNWKIYTEPISVESGKTIYAKIQDNDNNLIGIVESKKIEDDKEKLDIKAYDNDSKTYGGSNGVKYLQIEDKMQGEKIEIDATYWTSYTDSYYEFLDENKQIIGTKIKSQRNKEETIPQGAKYIKFTNCAIFEIYKK